jgi:hypothetical protein
MENVGRQGLLAAGASLLANMQPRRRSEAPGFLGSIGQALQAGQEAAGGALQSGVGQQTIARQQEYQDAIDAATQRGASDEELLGIHQQYGNVGMAQVFASRIHAKQQRRRFVAEHPSTGQLVYAYELPDGSVEYTQHIAPQEVADRRARERMEEQLNQRGRQTRSQARREFNNRTHEAVESFEQLVSGLQALDELQLDPRGSGAIAKVEALYTFVKGIDPGSVVREGEVRLVTEAQAIADRFKTFLDDVTRGRSPAVPDTVLDQLRSSFLRLQGGLSRRINFHHDSAMRYVAGEGFLEGYENFLPDLSRFQQQGPAGPEVDIGAALGAGVDTQAGQQVDTSSGALLSPEAQAAAAQFAASLPQDSAPPPPATGPLPAGLNLRPVR